MSVHILGIRHHGPGSARNVKAFLEELKPDIVLVEGPPEADAILEWAANKELKPPVAILAYQADDISKALFYPFAAFSPEWQAIQYAQKNNIHVRFMDLPLAHGFALADAEEEKKQANETTEDQPQETTEEIYSNPVAHLAAADGFDDAEQWWEHMFEHRRQNERAFEAVHEAMTALRDTLPPKDDRNEQLREAWMRKIIRQAEKEMFGTIAVICGAWHVPALAKMPKQKENNELLKGLSKVKIETTWIPWTYSRLSFDSGYGAGIQSPGWYDHVWKHPDDDGTRWMAKVAKLFRKNNIDTSVAHVIEAVRLAESLAAMRGLSKAGLAELNESTISVLCGGEPIMLELVRDQLIVSNKIGTVPADIPKPPLQVDIERQQKKLRLPAGAGRRDYTLDLRKDYDLERSILLHRLQLLDIPWGIKSHIGGKGTFKELWHLQWDPSFTISIIEKGVWGNTLEEAANAWLTHRCEKETSLPAIAELLQQVIPAELAGAAVVIARRIESMAAAGNDVLQLVVALPRLVSIIRYGNVRRTDADMVRGIAESMITRVCIGLPVACCGIDDTTAGNLAEDCVRINHSIQVLQEPVCIAQWDQCLQQIVRLQQAAPMMRGFAARQLMDSKAIQPDALQQLFYSSLSRSLPVAETAAWLEGFLKGSGTILLINDELWQIIDSWVLQLQHDEFIQALPLLRRTFSAFTQTERRKIGEKVKYGGSRSMAAIETDNRIDVVRARKGLPVVMRLMGINE